MQLLLISRFYDQKIKFSYPYMWWETIINFETYIYYQLFTRKTKNPNFLYISQISVADFVCSLYVNSIWELLFKSSDVVRIRTLNLLSFPNLIIYCVLIHETLTWSWWNLKTGNEGQINLVNFSRKLFCWKN